LSYDARNSFSGGGAGCGDQQDRHHNFAEEEERQLSLQRGWRQQVHLDRVVEGLGRSMPQPQHSHSQVHLGQVQEQAPQIHPCENENDGEPLFI